MSEQQAETLAAEESGPVVTDRPPPFDVLATQILRQAAAAIFVRCPEVRSVCATLDYYGELNDANVRRGIWVSDHGNVDTPDGIFGSMFQTLRLMEEQFNRAIAYAQGFREEAQELAAENLRLVKINEELREAVAAAEAQPGAEPGGVPREAG